MTTHPPLRYHHPHHRIKHHPLHIGRRYLHAPWTASQMYVFSGALRDPDSGKLATYAISTLAQDSTAPTITGGFAQINTIARPRRLGYTLAGGYDPISMDVPAQFEAMGDYDSHYGPKDVERDIQILEWMAGRGKLYAKSNIGRAAVGNPPLITFRVLSRGDTDTQLVPPNVQGLEWVISNIQYDTSPIRDGQGNRRRQLATVTLTQWMRIPTAKTTVNNGFQKYHITAQQRTIEAVVVHNTDVKRGDHQAMREVLKACRDHGVHVRSVRQKLKIGTRVFIPAKLYRVNDT